MSTPSQPLLFVTGATGFLGLHLVDELLAQGFHLRALVRDQNSAAAQKLAGKVELIRGDIGQAQTLREAMQGCEGLFHCAGMVSRDPEDALAMHRVHVEGTRVCLESAKAAGIKRCVVASTSGIVALSEDPDKISREDDPAPLELLNRFPYYRSKLYAEQVAFSMNQEGFEVICVNPSLLLGPGDHKGSSTLDVERYLERPSLITPTGGVSFVDARDAAAAMRLAYLQGRPGERYLLASCNCTLRTFFGRLARLAGAQSPTWSTPGGSLARRAAMWFSESARNLLGEDDHLPDPASLEMAYYYWYADASKAERELAWSPREPMQTLSDTIEDLRERGRIPLRYE